MKSHQLHISQFCRLTDGVHSNQMSKILEGTLWSWHMFSWHNPLQGRAYNQLLRVPWCMEYFLRYVLMYQIMIGKWLSARVYACQVIRILSPIRAVRWSKIGRMREWWKDKQSRCCGLRVKKGSSWLASGFGMGPRRAMGDNGLWEFEKGSERPPFPNGGCFYVQNGWQQIGGLGIREAHLNFQESTRILGWHPSSAPIYFARRESLRCSISSWLSQNGCGFFC